MTKRVSVYWNLHKHTWSVRGPEGRVILHADEVLLGKPGTVNCKFTVGQKGRLRVRQEGRKNVHAFARGPYWASNRTSHSGDYVNRVSTWLDLAQANDDPLVVGVTYNPYRHVQFVDTHVGAEVHTAKWIHLDKSPKGFPVVRAVVSIDDRINELELLKHSLEVRQWQLEGKSLQDRWTDEDRAEHKVLMQKSAKASRLLTTLYAMSLNRGAA